MVRSAAKTAEEFLDELPADRKEVMTEMRKLILEHLPKGYAESVNWGMLAYEVPLSTYPDTYNKQPLCYAALASHKNYCSLYLMGVYGHPAQLETLRAGFSEIGKKMNMGKSCIRFKSLSDLPLPTIGKLIAAVPPEKMIAMHEQVHRKKR